VLVGFDADKHRDADVDLGRVEQRHAFADETCLFKALHPSPRGRWRELDLGGKFVDANRGIFLQALQNALIEAIEGDFFQLWSFGRK
jgi:hypothetical protein